MALGGITEVDGVEKRSAVRCESGRLDDAPREGERFRFRCKSRSVRWWRLECCTCCVAGPRSDLRHSLVSGSHSRGTCAVIQGAKAANSCSNTSDMLSTARCRHCQNCVENFKPPGVFALNSVTLITSQLAWYRFGRLGRRSGGNLHSLQ